MKVLLHMVCHATHYCTDAWQASAGDQGDKYHLTDLWGRQWSRRALAR